MAYRDYVLGLSPLWYYEFDEVAGTVVTDSTTNGNDGAFDLEPVWEKPSLVPRSSGTAVEFTDKYITLPGATVLASQWSYVLNVQFSGSPYEDAILGTDVSLYYLKLDDSVGSLFIGSDKKLITNLTTWTDLLDSFQLMVTYDSGAWKAYINGVLAGTYTFSFVGTVLLQTIGYMPSGYKAAYDMDEAFFINGVALTSEQAVETYNQSVGIIAVSVDENMLSTSSITPIKVMALNQGLTTEGLALISLILTPLFAGFGASSDASPLLFLIKKAEAGLTFDDEALNPLFLFVKEIMAVDDVEKTRLFKEVNVIANTILGTQTAPVLLGEFLVRASTSLALKTLVVRGFGLYASEDIALKSDLQAFYNLILKVIESLSTSAHVAIDSVELTIIATDGLDLNTDIKSLHELKLLIESGMAFIAEYDKDAVNNQVMVLNTLSKGISEYTNFGFNSAANGLLCREDGLYRVEGSKDLGEDVPWSITTGKYDFDKTGLKQMPYAYLGVTSTGSMVLKTIVDFRGVKKEYWYESAQTRGATDTIRIQMGKGVKSRYWQFKLSGNEPVEIDSIELLPLFLSRRI